MREKLDPSPSTSFIEAAEALRRSPDSAGERGSPRLEGSRCRRRGQCDREGDGRVVLNENCFTKPARGEDDDREVEEALQRGEPAQPATVKPLAQPLGVVPELDPRVSRC